MHTRASKSGFTLIELLIVVGIISILIVVLAIAVLPWLGKSDEKASRNLLQTIGPVMAGREVPPMLATFKKDAGKRSGQIAGDEDKASSQMMLFYSAPSRSSWDGSALYKDRNYEPDLQPENFVEFTREDSGLPYLVDAWDHVIWYKYNNDLKAGFVYSRGADNEKGNDDDLIYDPRDNKVKNRDEMR